MSGWSKLEWQKRLRGRELTPTEYMVLMALSTYTDGDGRGAHPGWTRLAADTRLDSRTVRRVVGRLVERGYLALTVEGGNQYRKGQASEYELGDLASAAPSCDLLGRGAPAPSFNETGRGAPGAPRGAAEALGRGAPAPSHQVLTSGPYIIPSPSVSGAAVAAPRVLETCEALEGWLIEELGELSNDEYVRADAMWESGQYPVPILNALLKQRRALHVVS